MYKTTKWIWVIVGIIIIPVTLNFLLQIKTGLIILGGSESAIYWLSFWGSYLAAIAAGFLGWVSLQINEKAIEQNQKNIEQNDKVLHESAWYRLVARYEHLEKYVGHEEVLYNPGYVDEILYLVESEKEKKEIKSILARKKKLLSLSSLHIIRYLRDRRASPEDPYLYNYGTALKSANKWSIEFVNKIEKNIDGFDYQTFKGKEEYLINQIESAHSRLIVAGTELLQSEKEEILTYAKSNNLPCGII